MSINEKIIKLEKQVKQNEKNLMKLLKSLPAIIENLLNQNNQTDLGQDKLEANKHMYNILNKKTK